MTINTVLARPPVITLKPESDIEAEPSTNELIVECESTGVPKPKITWFWNDNLISDGEVSGSPSITIIQIWH